MPWEGPIESVLNSLTGPVAQALCILAVVALGFGMAFSEGGGMMRRSMGILFSPSRPSASRRRSSASPPARPCERGRGVATTTTRDELPEGYEVPMHLALTQPILFGGVPRSFGILNVTLSLVLALGLHLWWLGVPLGLAVHVAAVWMTKRDAWWFDVFRRHLRAPRFIDV